MSEARGTIAAQVLELVRQREVLASQLSRIDDELATIKRALSGGPTSTYLPERSCLICRNPFQPKRKDQEICSACRQDSPRRSNVEIQDKKARGNMVESQCKGYKDHPCARTVQRLANRRGPLRCPDCQLAHKRHVVRVSLDRIRVRTTEEKAQGQSPERACRGCGATFIPKAGSAGVYCSRECYQNPHRANRSRNAKPAEPPTLPTSLRDRVARRAAPELETVWNGGQGLTSVGRDS